MTGHIGAVVLAAGQSRRMGQPKLMLPWGEWTVIEQVVGTLLEADIHEIVVVTGGSREAVEAALTGLPICFAHNPQYEQAEMLTSLQTGIRALSPECQALLIVLGDQPTLEATVVRAVVEMHQATGGHLVVPSYQMRRGHPWLVERALWQELLNMPPEQTMRDFVHAHAEEIQYVNVNTPGILQDMDTPEDYRRLRPGGTDQKAQ